MSIINCSGVYIRVLSVVSHTVVVLNYTLHYQGCIMLHYYITTLLQYVNLTCVNSEEEMPRKPDADRYMRR